MAEKSPHAFLRVVESIETHSGRVKELAAEITDRIVKFEQWLAKMPGRVEAFHWIEDPDYPPDMNFRFGIALRRHEKSWAVFFAYRDQTDDEDEPTDWNLLREGPLTAKGLAVPLFPDLLKKIRDAQKNRVAELEKTRDEFDTFAAALGITEKEGK